MRGAPPNGCAPWTTRSSSVPATRTTSCAPPSARPRRTRRRRRGRRSARPPHTRRGRWRWRGWWRATSRSPPGRRGGARRRRCPRMPELLASLHDVAPFHLERLRRAEAVLGELGATRVTYLLVPDFHRRGRADLDPGFLAWCRGPRPFAVRWALHGYTHRDEPGAGVARTPLERWKARHLTGGEGEFLSRDAAELEERLERGRAVFRAVVGSEPAGVVAPAWLQTPVLPPLPRR